MSQVLITNNRVDLDPQAKFEENWILDQLNV